MKKIVTLLLILVLVFECALFHATGTEVHAEEQSVTWLDVGRQPGTQVVCSEVNSWAASDPAASIYLPSSLNNGDTNTYSGYYITETKQVAESTVTISYVFDALYKVDNVTLWPCYQDGVAVGFPADFTISVKTKNGGWRTVVTKQGYTVEGQGGQAFVFDSIIGKEVMVSVSKMTPIGKDENGVDTYGVYMTEMQVLGYPTESLGATENIALSITGTKASAQYATAEEFLVEAGYTTDALIDGDDSEWAPSFATGGNSKAEDDVVIQLDFPGWYTMDNLSLKPRMELAGEEWKVVGFPEEFDISIQTEHGWQKVLEVTDYKVDILDIQSFDFVETKGNALRLHVTKVPETASTDPKRHIMYLTEMYVYGNEAKAPGYNILQNGNMDISTDSTSSWATDNGYTIDKLIDNRTDYGALGYFSDEYETPDKTITIDVDFKDFYKVSEIILYPYWTDWDKVTLNNFPIDFFVEVKTIDGWIKVKEVNGYVDASNDANQFTFDTEYDCNAMRIVITKLAESPVNAGNYVVGLSELQVRGRDSEVSYVAPEENRELVSKDVHCVAGAALGLETTATAVNDGNDETLYTGNKYTTGNVEKGEYILMTLERPARISEITIQTNKIEDTVYGFPTDFQIRAYSDGKWQTVVERTNFSTTLTTLGFTFEAVEAERIEFFATGLSKTQESSYALQLKEMSVYGLPTTTNVTADLNLDYTLDDEDAEHMRKVLLNEEYLVLKGADVNSDAQTNAQDLVALLKRKIKKSKKQDETKGITYYVDASAEIGGSGLSPEEPLRTLDEASELHLQAGDQLLFKRGTGYQGCLEIKSSGEEGNPIVVGAYGEGEKPRIHGNGLVDAALYAENVSYITVRNLEVTNEGDKTKQHRGIYFVAKSRSIYGITIENCYVHDVDSSVENVDVTITGSGDHHWTGGIVVRARSEMFCAAVADLRKLSVNDVLIRNNEVEACAQVGIIAGGSDIDGIYPSLEVCIRGNTVKKCYGDGVMVFGCHGAIVEGNVASENAAEAPTNHRCAGIWCAVSTGTLFQYNESSKMKSNKDGQGYDVDNKCSGTLLQYNYSHDNYGGAVLLMQNNSGSVTLRYNISQNDGHDRSALAFLWDEDNNIINLGVDIDVAPYLTVNAHHNIIYTSQRDVDVIGYSGTHHKFKTDNVGTMSQNIFYVTGSSPSMSEDDATNYLDFDGNIYYGVSATSSDTSGKKNDPQFQNPGGAGNGILSLDAYVLKPTSPYTDIGFKIAID